MTVMTGLSILSIEYTFKDIIEFIYSYFKKKITLPSFYTTFIADATIFKKKN